MNPRKPHILHHVFIAIVICPLLPGTTPSPAKLPLDQWTYIEVDSKRDKYRITGAASWWGYFGVDLGDLNGDGLLDIASGEFYYRNPGGNMPGPWPRINFPFEVDAMLITDVDGDSFGDVIAQRLPDVFWLEAEDANGDSWSATRIGLMKQTDHANTQDYALGQLIPGGKPEILLGAEDGLYYFEIPGNPSGEFWPKTRITSEGNGYGIGDIDGDGFPDVIGSVKVESEEAEVPGAYNSRWFNSEVSWWRNPGDSSGDWQLFKVGRATNADRFAVADLNGDDLNDIIISEERYPGTEPNGRLYWFEHPRQIEGSAWNRHLVVEQYSMNNLDVADIDRDGDIDIVTNEHKMPGGKGAAPLVKNERTQVWENDGRGNFTRIDIDQGKESHLGSQLADLDNDGDLDMVSIAWRDYQYLHLWRNDAVKRPMASESEQRPYSAIIDVHANGFERIDKPVEIEIDFNKWLNALSAPKTFDPDSIRVDEIDANGYVTEADVPFQWNPVFNFDPEKLALGEVVFLMRGKTGATATRHFRISFDHAGKTYDPSKFTSLVTAENLEAYEGYPSFKITTPSGDYYYHIKGSGFASLIDPDGNDWIGFHPQNEENLLGEKAFYRGIPNINAHFHPGPGEDNAESRLIHNGPFKVTIQSESLDKQWGGTWDIYPDYATFTLNQKGEDPFWLLYEGTPGGEFNLTDYWVDSAGNRIDVAPYVISNQWQAPLPSPKWVYFGDPSLDRVLYLAFHGDHPGVDQFWHFGEGTMTVFGFGRGAREIRWRQLTEVPSRMTIGFSERSNYPEARKTIESAYRELKISVRVDLP